MKDPRFTGLLLLLTGVLVLMGNTMNVLPPEAFWAGLLTYPIGGYLFFIGSRGAIERIETRTERAVEPRLGNESGQRFAKLQARSSPNPNAARPQGADAEAESRIVASLRGGPSAAAESTPQAEPLAFHDLEDEQTDFQVTEDVSFPVEVQERQSLADQLEKLSKLQHQGIISAEEYTVAKAKLLG